jgi:hypothetical protein
MNNWFKIAVPLLIAVLLITATVGITLAVTARGAAGQASVPLYTPGQETGTQYARGPQCSNCAGNAQGAVTGDQDDSTGSVYVPKGATCSNCPGYGQGSTTATPGSQGTVTSTVRGGCCRGR